MRNGPVVDDYTSTTGHMDWLSYYKAQARWAGVAPVKPSTPVVDEDPRWVQPFDAYVSDWEDEF